MSQPLRQSSILSSLDDSSYEILDTPYIGSDDEDGNTISVASTTDDHVSDDLYATDNEDVDTDNDNDNDNDNDDEDETKESGMEQGQSDLADNFTARSFTDSNVTVTGAERRQWGPSPRQMRSFDNSENVSYTKYRELIREYTRNDAPQELQSFDTEFLNVYFNMGIGKNCGVFDIDQPIRVWYFGNASPRLHIIHKISEAFYRMKANGFAKDEISPRPGMFNIFPLTASGSDVTVLESCGLDLEVKDCRRIYCPPQNISGSYPDRIIKADIGGLQVLFDRIEHNIYPASGLSPDLAIFCHSDNDQPFQDQYDHELMLKVRDILNRNNVPVLDITTSSMLGTASSQRGLYPLGFQCRSAYFSAEAQNMRTDVGIVVDTSPIDLGKFLDLNAEILGAHLKAIMECWSWHPKDEELVGPNGRTITKPHKCRNQHRRKAVEALKKTQESIGEARRDRILSMMSWKGHSHRSVPLGLVFLIIVSLIGVCLRPALLERNSVIAWSDLWSQKVPVSGQHASVTHTVAAPSATSAHAAPGLHSVAVWENLFGILPAVPNKNLSHVSNERRRRDNETRERKPASARKTFKGGPSNMAQSHLKVNREDGRGDVPGQRMLGNAARLYVSSAFYEIRSSAANVSTECFGYMRNISKAAYDSVEDTGASMLESLDGWQTLQLIRRQGDGVMKAVKGEAAYRANRARKNAKRLTGKLRRGCNSVAITIGMGWL